MKLSIIGAGYVGLVTGVCLAEKGHDVVCVDTDESKTQSINQGVAPIHEPGLTELLEKNVNRRLRATTDLRAAVVDTDASMLCVGTPFDGDGIDLRYVRRAAFQVGEALRERDPYHLVVVKSTVVPGTTEEVVAPILEDGSGKTVGRDFGLAMNPEFLREGEAVGDFMSPDRIVLGGVDERSRDMLAALYRPFQGVSLVRTSTRSAEMIKYASNALLATLISFSNEIGSMCAETEDVDVVEVLKAVSLDGRFSPTMPDGRRITAPIMKYLEAGCGFGGSCLPKDVRALIAFGQTLQLPMKLLNAVIEINERQPQEIVRLLSRQFPSIRGLSVAVLGVAFKPGTDDVRESPALPIIRHLVAKGASVRVFDPVANDPAREALADCEVAFSDRLEEAIRSVDAIVLVTRWPEFRRLPELILPGDRSPIVIDARRFLSKDSVARYFGVGLRGTALGGDRFQQVGAVETAE